MRQAGWKRHGDRLFSLERFLQGQAGAGMRFTIGENRMSPTSPRLKAVQTLQAVAFAPILAGLLLGSSPVVLAIAAWRGCRRVFRFA